MSCSPNVISPSSALFGHHDDVLIGDFRICLAPARDELHREARNTRDRPHHYPNRGQRIYQMRLEIGAIKDSDILRYNLRKTRMEKVVAAENMATSPSANAVTKSPPATVAPAVLAMVFKLRIAEDVPRFPCGIFPAFHRASGPFFLRPSISVGVVLRIKASSKEQSAEAPMVKATAR